MGCVNLNVTDNSSSSLCHLNPIPSPGWAINHSTILLWILGENLCTGAPLMAQKVKNLSTVWKTRVWSLCLEDPLKKGMAAHSSILAWSIPWTVEPGRLQSMGLQRVRHDWAPNTFTLSPLCRLPHLWVFCQDVLSDVWLQSQREWGQKSGDWAKEQPPHSRPWRGSVTYRDNSPGHGVASQAGSLSLQVP